MKEDIETEEEGEKIRGNIGDFHLSEYGKISEQEKNMT